jgi:hypothetical protein
MILLAVAMRFSHWIELFSAACFPIQWDKSEQAVYGKAARRAA